MKVNYKIYVQGFSCRHAAEPRIKKGLEKGMGPGGQKKSLSFEKYKNELYPLNCRVGRCESAAEGGVCYGKDVLAGRHGGGW